MESTIRLFKALPIENKEKKNPTKDLLKKTIKLGFVFSPEVIANYSNYDDLIKSVSKELGLSGEQLNSSFHKSWKKIKEADIEELIFEQIAHYFTTYGFEFLGIYNENSVYIPFEKLEVPELKENIPLILIKGYTKEEIKDKLLEFLNSGIALKEDTINDVVEVAEFVEFEKIGQVRNKEVKVMLYDKLDKIPENNVEFLRYLIYKSTGKTLLIKNKQIISEIKSSDFKIASYRLLNKYKKQYGLEKLSEIFYRFKPLFLAFRNSNELNKRMINQIRRLAKENHKPMEESYLNSVTSLITNDKLDTEKLKEELNKVNIFRKIRLAYALNYRTKDVDTILYRIRNGKGYATGFNPFEKNATKKVLDIVLKSIAKDIESNVKGKKIYIPDYITYALPSTEKQFTGYFPSGTYVSIPKDMIVGVHWENGGEDGYSNERIDLDLSLLSTDGKYGWDRSYRNEDRSILFSGDMTYAPKPNGATELFYVKKQSENAYLLNLNYFNFNKEVEVPFKIIVAKERPTDFKLSYMVNPNNVVSIVKSKINKSQMILGLLITTPEECRFYFSETYLGNSRTSYNSDYMENSRKYLLNFYQNSINLNELLEKAGAKIVKDKEKCDIDLSPESIEKDTIINLIKNK